jgi:hypothetical protein
VGPLVRSLALLEPQEVWDNGMKLKVLPLVFLSGCLTVDPNKPLPPDFWRYLGMLIVGLFLGLALGFVLGRSTKAQACQKQKDGCEPGEADESPG